MERRVGNLKRSISRCIWWVARSSEPVEPVRPCVIRAVTRSYFVLLKLRFSSYRHTSYYYPTLLHLTFCFCPLQFLLPHAAPAHFLLLSTHSNPNQSHSTPITLLSLSYHSHITLFSHTYPTLPLPYSYLTPLPFLPPPHHRYEVRFLPNQIINGKSTVNFAFPLHYFEITG
jgi:hypothetical protein